nr:MAG TPA: hypothetical protein [Caudoviricetes sp.]
MSYRATVPGSRAHFRISFQGNRSRADWRCKFWAREVRSRAAAGGQRSR